MNPIFKRCSSRREEAHFNLRFAICNFQCFSQNTSTTPVRPFELLTSGSMRGPNHKIRLSLFHASTLPRFHALMCFFALLALFCGNLSRAADKSGVSPNTISVPKGPGSIEGLGESFQPTLNTGTAKYNIALKVPPGTAGQTPELRLSYEGGRGNGPLGFGWNLSLPIVQRRTDKGTPLYEGEA